MNVAEKQQSRTFRLVGYLWLKVGKDIQLSVERMSDIQIVFITTAPAEGLAVCDSFEVARADSAAVKNFLLGEITADDANNTDVSKEAG